MPMVLKVLPALPGKQQSTGLLYFHISAIRHFYDHFSISVHSHSDCVRKSRDFPTG